MKKISKTLDQLIDKVQNEGAAKIQRSNFQDHASAMKAYQSRMKTGGQINAVTQDKDQEEVLRE